MRRRPAAFAAVLALAFASSAIADWRVVWTASPQPLWSGEFPLSTQVPDHFWRQTLRQSMRVALGGRRVRVMLSNEYGAQALRIGAAHLARAGRDGSVAAGSDRVLRFDGAHAATVPPGAILLSDPLELDVNALETLSVSLYLPEPTPPSTFHWDARQTAYVGAGDQTAAPAMQVDARLQARAFVRDILVDGGTRPRTVVAFGDSITDGNASTPDLDHRWPDFLAARLAPQNVVVLNAGISGARLLKTRMGDSALARFERDVLAQPGLASVIVLMGINDIAWPGHAFAPQEAPPRVADLIGAYRQLIARAHLRGVRVVGATLTPFEGALQGTPLEGYYRPERDALREAVNRWVRDSGEFDAVVDFDALLRDPQHPSRLRAGFDSGDHLHPGDAGYRAMADALDAATLFGATLSAPAARASR
ncbi:SGNH/GDSL hydrolase family protein [Solimonas soli]|uniref:SGNH/GDSL hydrolase family protein n=1 Tax=Solimonas soli TaxID=413479 RepID=UPI0004BA088B|nr:SGNH/GDSL hydrolase family protein [Solimonas soli]